RPRRQPRRAAPSPRASRSREAGRRWRRRLQPSRGPAPSTPTGGGRRSPRQKSKELVAIARILHAEFRDAEGAIEALEMARAMDPGRVSVLQALRRGYERLERWPNALEVTAALAGLGRASP